MLRNLIRTEIAHQSDLFTEKFAKVDIQFKMLENRTAEQKEDTMNALTAALTSQKEAAASQTISLQKNTDKSETATIERIKAVETLLSASSRASDDKIDDLKSRVVAIEAVKLGNAEGTATIHQSGTDTRAIIATIVGVVGVLLAVAGFAIAIFKP